jgi:hypothetical protein
MFDVRCSMFMNLPAKATLMGWQPLTPRGIAAFARMPLSRLFLVQFVAAALAAASVVWFLDTAWFPVVADAIHQLPPRGDIRSGRLAWSGDSPQALAGGGFLSFAVDLRHVGEARLPAHVQVEFGETNVRVFSLFGFAEWAYPRDVWIAFNQPELEPWWGAWAPPLLWISAAATIAVLMIVWAFLATLWFLPVCMIGFFANRQLDLAGSWKMAGAALMPGALLMAGGIVAYGLGSLALVSFLVLAAAHIVVGWAYMFVSPLFAPRAPDAPPPGENPFALNS